MGDVLFVKGWAIWAPTRPRLTPYFHPTRRGCIAEFEGDIGIPWKTLYRQGYRCERAELISEKRP